MGGELQVWHTNRHGHVYKGHTKDSFKVGHVSKHRHIHGGAHGGQLYKRGIYEGTGIYTGGIWRTAI